MAVREEKIESEGEVVEALATDVPGEARQRAQTSSPSISGKMRKHYIRILPGDRVRVELSPYDLTRGRITFRMNLTK